MLAVDDWGAVRGSPVWAAAESAGPAPSPARGSASPGIARALPERPARRPHDPVHRVRAVVAVRSRPPCVDLEGVPHRAELRGAIRAHEHWHRPRRGCYRCRTTVGSGTRCSVGIAGGGRGREASASSCPARAPAGARTGAVGPSVKREVWSGAIVVHRADVCSEREDVFCC